MASTGSKGRDESAVLASAPDRGLPVSASDSRHVSTANNSPLKIFMRRINTRVDDGNGHPGSAGDLPRAINPVLAYPILPISNLVSPGGGNGENNPGSDQRCRGNAC
jgi:hypothetical protein